jgi:hypothetical protein
VKSYVLPLLVMFICAEAEGQVRLSPVAGFSITFDGNHGLYRHQAAPVNLARQSVGAVAFSDGELGARSSRLCSLFASSTF